MSHKTPKTTTKKTKLVRSIVITAFVTALFLSLLATLHFENQAATPTAITPANGCAGLLAQRTCYTLERAETNQARAHGLSDRDSLRPQTGMLFVFDRPDEQCFWMKDMRFDLDMVFVNDAKAVTKIEQNVSPDTYPNSFCAKDTKYVIELNSGEAAKSGLSVGQLLTF